MVDFIYVEDLLPVVYSVNKDTFSVDYNYYLMISNHFT